MPPLKSGAPDLIYHYVVAHDYLPPASFIEAACQWVPPEGAGGGD